MKNMPGLALSALILIVLGCNCGDRLKELSKKDSQPTNRTTPTTSSSPEAPTSSSTKGEYDVTMDKYERVKTGMKRGDVENIFGGKGTEYYSGKGGGVSFVSVKWVGDKFKTVLVSFRNDKVTSKSQVGLQ